MIGAQGEVYSPQASWQFSLSYRHLHSDRRYVGSDEAPHPHAAVNDINVVDLSLSYALTERYALDLTIPTVFMNREQSVRAGQSFGARFDTQARGIGDISFLARGWLWDPANHQRRNVSLGIGVKAPTGNADVTDQIQTFTTPVVQTVDQSIQPGDGGWGIPLNVSAFSRWGDLVTLFSTLDYLSNPRGTNDVRTYRPRASEAIMSVPDQYLGRLGVQLPFWSNWLGSLAGRIEGVPAHDLLGPSDGFRRPGYAVSIEPGLIVPWRSSTFSAAMPIAIYRNRVKSTPDEMDDPIPQTLGNGDAAFADYFVLLGFSYRF